LMHLQRASVRENEVISILCTKSQDDDRWR